MYVSWYIRTISVIFLIQECTLSQNINTNHAALYSTCIRTFITWILRRQSIISHNVAYRNLIDGALDNIPRRTRFGRHYGPVARQATEGMNVHQTHT